MFFPDEELIMIIIYLSKLSPPFFLLNPNINSIKLVGWLLVKLRQISHDNEASVQEILGNVEYPFISITPTPTQTQSDSTC